MYSVLNCELFGGLHVLCLHTDTIQQNPWHITGTEKILAKWKNEWLSSTTFYNYNSQLKTVMYLWAMIHVRPMDITEKTVFWKIIVNCKLTVEKGNCVFLFPVLSFSSPMEAPFDSGKDIFPFKVVVPPRLLSCLPRHYLRARRNQRKLNYSTRMFEEKESNRSSMTMLITRQWFWALHEQNKIPK